MFCNAQVDNCKIVEDADGHWRLFFLDVALSEKGRSTNTHIIHF